MHKLGPLALLLLAPFGCDRPEAPPAKPATAAQTAAVPQKAEPKFAVNKFTRSVIPPDLLTLPQPVGGLWFTDAQGDHVAVISQDDTTRAIRLQVAQVADGKTTRVLHQHDVEDHCEFDFFANFELGALGVTDLDGDDIAEVTVMFKHACISDVSPKSCELWMLEGDTRRTLKGSEILVLPGAEPIGEGKATEEGFADAPQQLEHAREVWRRHVVTEVRDAPRPPK